MNSRNWDKRRGHKNKLKADKNDEPEKGLIHKSIRVKTDSEHVDAEPRKRGDDIAENHHSHDPTFRGYFSPPGVEDKRIPKNDHQRAIFLRIPSPKASPGLVSPNSAEDRADKTE